jgi:hypothetical protein
VVSEDGCVGTVDPHGRMGGFIGVVWPSESELLDDGTIVLPGGSTLAPGDRFDGGGGQVGKEMRKEWPPECSGARDAIGLHTVSPWPRQSRVSGGEE